MLGEILDNKKYLSILAKKTFLARNTATMNCNDGALLKKPAP